jgi:hypothetical protein
VAKVKTIDATPLGGQKNVEAADLFNRPNPAVVVALSLQSLSLERKPSVSYGFIEGIFFVWLARDGFGSVTAPRGHNFVGSCPLPLNASIPSEWCSAQPRLSRWPSRGNRAFNFFNLTLAGPTTRAKLTESNHRQAVTPPACGVPRIARSVRPTADLSRNSKALKIPLRQDELIVIQAPPDGFDPQALQAAVDPLGMIVCLVERSSLAEAEMKRLLTEQGVTYVWRLVRLQEAVVPQTKHVEPLVRVLESMLAKLAPSQDFVIVDRYLFSKGSDPGYPALLASLLAPIARAVRRIKFITGRRSDSTLLKRVQEFLLAEAPSLSVVHDISDDFHDRFWIADQSRGLFLGTSLNGLGKRYALVDYMAPHDVREIVDSLRTRGLL